MINVSTLVLEIGRMCNLKCKHCLRGDSQNVTMPIEMAKKTLKMFKSIGCIVFSGGEPALYGKEIAEIIDFIIEKKIIVTDFYIASNGVIYNPVLMNALVKFYAYIDCGEVTCFDISTDKYHDESFYEIYPDSQPRYDFRLKAYSFVNNRGDINSAAVLREGNAEKNNLGTRVLKKNTKFEIYNYDNKEYDIDNLYISSLGQIAPLCDFSYDSLEKLNLPNINDINNKEELLNALVCYNNHININET